MDAAFLPIGLFVLLACGVGLAMVLVGQLAGPQRSTPVKRMPYESGMDPVHDARRRFDIHFHLVAVAFLLFDVEVLFLYPWAVAQTAPEGLAALEAGQGGLSRGLVLAEILWFVAILGAGLVYVWRRGLFRWR